MSKLSPRPTRRATREQMRRQAQVERLAEEMAHGGIKRMTVRVRGDFYEKIQQYAFRKNKTVTELTLEMWANRLKFAPRRRSLRDDPE